MAVKTEKFKPFDKTFKFCAFGLAFGLIYPNPNNIKKRLFLAVSTVGFNSVALMWFFFNIHENLSEGDIYNLIRNLTMGILVLLFLFKLFYVTYITKEFNILLNKISNDLLKGNELETDYQEIYEDYVKRGKVGQLCWIIIPIVMSCQFPLYAGIQTMIEYFRGGTTKYMVHEMNLTFIKDKQYESPYYELVFMYNCMNSLTFMPNFAGFDGSFCIATTHLRLKLKLMIHKIHRAFKDAKNKYELREKIKETVKDHQDALEFYVDIQKVYGPWLLCVFLVTAIAISFNIYLLYLSNTLDPKYTIYALSGVIHMYTPCYFSSVLLALGESLSSEIYCTPWEDAHDPVVTKLLIFMIARSQQRLILTGQGMVYFNMQLFVSMLQSSYSFFTIITA